MEIKIIFRWCLNRYYSMILIWCYCKSSALHPSFIISLILNSATAFYLFSLFHFCFDFVTCSDKLFPLFFRLFPFPSLFLTFAAWETGNTETAFPVEQSNVGIGTVSLNEKFVNQLALTIFDKTFNNFVFGNIHE